MKEFSKEDLINLMDWVKVNYKPHKMYTSRQLIDLWIKSKAHIESLRVRENKSKVKNCSTCRYKNAMYCDSTSDCGSKYQAWKAI